MINKYCPDCGTKFVVVWKENGYHTWWPLEADPKLLEYHKIDSLCTRNNQNRLHPDDMILLTEIEEMG